MCINFNYYCIVLITYKYRTSEKFTSYLQSQNLSILKTYMIFLIITPLISKILTDKSIITILHYFTKNPADKIVYVDEIIHQKFCRHGIKLIGYEQADNGKVCNISKDTLDNLKHNQRIILHGEESYFGFTYKSFSYDENK